MNVRVAIQFKPPTEEDYQSMRFIAEQLTKAPKEIRVFAAPEQPDWLIVEFTTPTEAQYKAVDKIDEAIRLWAWRRWDSTISFPLTPEEAERAKRKNERAKARRRSK